MADSDTEELLSREDDDELDSSTLSTWKFVEETLVELGIDDVEQYLLAKARLEVPQVAERLMTRMYGKHSRPLQPELPVEDIVQLWLDPTVLMLTKQHINANLDVNAFATVNEVKRLLEVELWLCFYSISPTKFYANENKRYYPPANKAMKRKRYYTLLNALGTSSAAISTSSDFWNAPFSPDRHLSQAMDAMRRVCSEIGFVNEVSIASLDDDLLRLRSKSVDDLGLTRTRNPAKGHVASRGETVVDVLRVLMRSLCGVSADSQIKLPGVVFALDRGYQSKEVNRQIMECGGIIIGTHKRDRSFPFTYGKLGTQGQTVMTEKGAKTTKWATMRNSVSSTKITSTMCALAYRSGLGSVVLCNTSLKSAGPGKWSYIPLPRQQQAHPDIHGNEFASFERRVLILTERQRTPDWFLMRQFRITGLVAVQILRAIAKASESPDELEQASENRCSVYHNLAQHTSVQLVQRILGILADSISGESRSSAGSEIPSESALGKMKNKELQQMCRDQGLTVSGNKRELISRLLNGESDTNSTKNTIKSPAAALLSAWFLAPISSTDMKVGSKNEENIRSRVPRFLEAHSNFRVLQTKSYGLLCCPEERYLAFSPDDIALVTRPSSSDLFFAVLEYKTKTRGNTVDTEQNISIPDQGHRSQLLHNIISGSVRDGFIVYASSTAIIRVVHVVIGDDIVDSYRLAFLKIKEACMDWIYTPGAPVPPFTAEELGHCGDVSTLKQHLALWRIVVAKIEERGGPLPAAKHIIPSVIAIWNRVKGGIDVYSRYLKNIKPSHEHLPPLAAIWLRFLMTLIYNAFQSAQLLSATAFLMDEDRCKSYSIYQQHKSENASFRDFCRDAASCLGGNANDDDSIDTPRRPLSEVDTNVLSANELGSFLLKPHSFAYRVRDHFDDDPEWRKLRNSSRELHNEV
ncbi:hypothetical protein DVH05_002427 [Phytophthora capsici]|nr:hypothetical protein DVH05_002427 [Phytophthora capsici]